MTCCLMQTKSSVKQFDVIHEKNMYGRKVMGIVRSTFLIDGEGVLQKEWRKVRVKGHVEEVLEAVKSLVNRHIIKRQGGPLPDGK